MGKLCRERREFFHKDMHSIKRRVSPPRRQNGIEGGEGKRDRRRQFKKRQKFYSEKGNKSSRGSASGAALQHCGGGQTLLFLFNKGASRAEETKGRRPQGVTCPKREVTKSVRTKKQGGCVREFFNEREKKEHAGKWGAKVQG